MPRKFSESSSCAAANQAPPWRSTQAPPNPSLDVISCWPKISKNPGLVKTFAVGSFHRTGAPSLDAAMKVLPRIPASRLALWSFSNLPNLRLEVGTRRISTRAAATPCALSAPILLTRGARTMHSAAPRGAKVAPMVGAGPPPLPPMSEDMASGRATASKDKKPDAYRWWKGVLVKEEDGTCFPLLALCLVSATPPHLLFFNDRRSPPRLHWGMTS